MIAAEDISVYENEATRPLIDSRPLTMNQKETSIDIGRSLPHSCVNALVLARTSGSPCTYTNQIDFFPLIFAYLFALTNECTASVQLLLVCILAGKFFFKRMRQPRPFNMAFFHRFHVLRLALF